MQMSNFVQIAQYYSRTFSSITMCTYVRIRGRLLYKLHSAGGVLVDVDRKCIEGHHRVSQCKQFCWRVCMHHTSVRTCGWSLYRVCRLKGLRIERKLFLIVSCFQQLVLLGIPCGVGRNITVLSGIECVCQKNAKLRGLPHAQSFTCIDIVYLLYCIV